MKKGYTFGISALILSLIVFLSTILVLNLNPREEGAGLPNPASVYCIDQGGRLEVREDSEGNQHGVCILPDGRECEEWSYYGGQCIEANKETSTMNNVSLEISTEKSVYEIGETVYVKVVLQNLGRRTVDYLVGTPCNPDFRVLLHTPYGSRELMEESYEPMPCIQVIDQRTLDSGERVERTVVWDQRIRMHNGTLQAPSGVYEIQGVFYAGKPVDCATVGCGGEVFTVEASVRIEIKAGAEPFITEADALQIALSNSEVASWYEEHIGRRLVKFEDGQWYVLIDGVYEKVTEEFAGELLECEPTSSTILEGNQMTVTLAQKLGNVPHELAVKIDIYTKEIISIEEEHGNPPEIGIGD